MSNPIIPTIFPDDAMFQGNYDHYFRCGESALRVILAAIEAAGTKPPKTILDFGAGAGRVTRWLQAEFPQAEISACDVREKDMQFLTASLNVKSWTVGADVSRLSIHGKYDLIWAGSVITHLSKENSQALIRKLLYACNINGLVVLSFHGANVASRKNNYIHDKAWQSITADYLTSGYGYADYDGSPGYGISICSTAAMRDLLTAAGHFRVILSRERAWDDHQDVIAVQKLG